MVNEGCAETLRIDIDRYPDEMDGNFFGINFAGVLIDDGTLDALRDSFGKMIQNADGSNPDMLEPMVLKATWEKLGIQEEMPSLYDMICWVVDINCFEGVEAISFTEFIE